MHARKVTEARNTDAVLPGGFDDGDIIRTENRLPLIVIFFMPLTSCRNAGSAIASAIARSLW
jgi:hypothetical protein